MPWEDAVKAQLTNDRAEYLHWKMQIDYLNEMYPHMRQPELMDEWGTKFHGRAKTVTGDIWWYEECMTDGTIKCHPLMPMKAKTMTTITIATIVKKIDDALTWRGPSDKVMGHVVLERDEAKYLRDWMITLCMERDELLARLDANKK